MRLRPLSEAECYARCYGARSEERVSVVRAYGVPAAPPPQDSSRNELREFFASWLDDAPASSEQPA